MVVAVGGQEGVCVGVGVSVDVGARRKGIETQQGSSEATQREKERTVCVNWSGRSSWKAVVGRRHSLGLKLGHLSIRGALSPMPVPVRARARA
jgi:hypothetical protein